MFISFDEMKSTIKKVLLNAGLSEEQAELCAQTHTESSRDGIESHGLNRIPRFVNYIDKEWVNLDGKMELINSKGFIEHYDGNLGIGIVNAKKASQRAIDMAKEYGLGMVVVRNTTHWMRGGTYTWDVVDQGFIGINWTNTESCMPVWGSIEQTIGNNPLCIGIPYKDKPFVLDMAISQYSYGKLETTRFLGEQLPYPGGFNKNNELTANPAEIEETGRVIPMGYWKGSGLSIALDLLATVISNGKSAADMDEEAKGSCTGCSQIFITIDPYLFSTREEAENNMDKLIQQIKSAERINKNREILYPGEGVIKRRDKSNTKGIHVDNTVWKKVKELQLRK